MDRQRYVLMGRCTNRQIGRQIGVLSDKQIERQRGRYMDKQTDGAYE